MAVGAMKLWKVRHIETGLFYSWDRGHRFDLPVIDGEEKKIYKKDKRGRFFFTKRGAERFASWVRDPQERRKHLQKIYGEELVHTDVEYSDYEMATDTPYIDPEPENCEVVEFDLVEVPA